MQKIDPEPLANFLYLLADEEAALMEQLAWISTHPVSKERAEYIIAEIKSKGGIHIRDFQFDLAGSKNRNTRFRLIGFAHQAL